MRLAEKVSNYYQPGVDEEGAPPALYTQQDYDQQGGEREGKGLGMGLGTVGGGLAGAGIGSLLGRFIGEKANIRDPNMAMYAGRGLGALGGALGGGLLGRHGGMPMGAGLAGLGALTLGATTPEGQQIARQLWEGTKGTVDEAGQAINNAMESTPQAIDIAKGRISNLAQDAVNHQGENLGEYAQNAMNNAGQAANTVGGNVANAATGAAGSLWNNAKNFANNIKNRFTGGVQGFQQRQ